MTADAPANAGAGRRPPPPFPVTILTGFLGAGKTTVLNDLLADGALADAIVLINEFGEIGLDHLLVEKVDGDMLLMASGCLCCTIRGDLVRTLEDILRRRDNDRIAPFARAVIETTGLADPAPILHTIMNHPYLAMRFRLDGIVTVVDAVNGAATIARHREAARQIAVADRIVLTKSDLPGADPGEVRERISALNPGALILDRARGEASASRILDVGLFDPAMKHPDVAAWLNAESVQVAHSRASQSLAGHSHFHHHDPNRHDESIRAFCLTRDAPIAPAALDLFLDLLRRAHGPKLLRLKGLVALADDPDRPVVIHGVQHVFHPPRRLERWPDEDRRTRIVLILDGLEPAFAERLFAIICGDAAPDQPDIAALLDNPLAPLASRSQGLLS